AVIAGIGLLVVRGSPVRRGMGAVAFVVLLAGVSRADRSEHYSPYYALTTDSIAIIPGFRILANGSLHQTPVDLAMGTEVGSPAHGAIRRGYHMPYRLLDETPKKVLILGAGSGNDVAVALDEGVEEIHAVEIDPVIIEIGRDGHPNRPYDSPRVRVINTDARTYLNDTDEVYDLIVFGTLDSMTRLSALSNVRLDNFVYTQESIDAARRRLAPDGGMVMYFMVGEEYINGHLVGILARSFGLLPTVFVGEYQMFNRIYMAGPSFAHLRNNDTESERAYIDEALPLEHHPTDDWPYLYLPGPSVNVFYLSLILLITVLAVVAVWVVSPELRRSALERGAVDWEMFLYGVAFLLIETKFVTAINLVWGATWLTSAVVFGSILLTILVGTVLMELAPVPWRVATAGLVVSLLVTYFIPVDLLIERGMLLRLALSVAYVGTPIFFASICFAHRFKVREHADLAFGWNLLGAVVGGLLEFFSMSLGLKALALVALLAYLVSFLVYEKGKAKTASTAAP
ncbi:MAG: hypothetical protein OEZ37_12700, partial [Gemmatimonadota bacterium]|nr:hypothetical protein [Gemmatimonadota bacterium]